MSLGSTLLTIFELALVSFTVWAVFHEDLFIDFEERIAAHVRRRKFRVIEGNRVGKTYRPLNNR